MELKQVAREALANFAAIAAAAGERLREKGISLDSLAVINQATAEKLAADMRARNEQRISDCHHLRREPTIARLVITDEFEQTETIYISPVGTIDTPGVRSCSYLSPMGRLAALPVGGGDDIRLPGGRRWFDVVEKMTFKPVQFGGEWDSCPAVEFREGAGPRSFRSLRALLRESGIADEQADILAQWLADEHEQDGNNEVEGLIHDALTAMGLRVQALLNAFQDEILRLPLDSRIAVLGPPGTGKTTTLIKRQRRTVDFQLLQPEEQELVEEPDGGGLDHPNSWIMFTPTELLRQYVKEAFGKQGVPVHDQRLWTWDAYRLEIGRRELGILRTGTRRGMVLREDLPSLLPDTLEHQTAWFEAFNLFQQDLFCSQLTTEAERLAAAADSRLAMMGRRILSAIERGVGKPLQLVGELAGFADELRSSAAGLNSEIQAALEAAMKGLAQADNALLDSLSSFVSQLMAETNADVPDDADDDGDDDDDDAEETQRLTGKRLTADVFRKALRARAIAQAAGRSVGARSRSGRVLEFLSARGLTLPDLKFAGARLLVQRAARRLARAPASWLSGMPLRYRQFRRVMRAENRWYTEVQVSASDMHPAEVDVLLLAILSQARAMATETLLKSRMGEQRPALFDAAGRLRRNQVLVDEATDFSPVQLAIMRNLADVRTDAVLVSGDFNQRLTTWGTRSEADLLWAVPRLDVRHISITYRQSRKLARFAVKLARLQGAEVDEQAPEGLQNDGFPPVLGTRLSTPDELASWLATQIGEINRLTNDAMPTIAVLADSEECLEPLAEALNAELATMNIRAVACPKGMVKGQDGDVRIFDVQHIKGLEFEAVFFVNVDALAA